MENGEGGPEFWVKYSSVKERVDALKRKNITIEEYDPIRICWEIGEILNHDEEKNLSFLQNKIRKLSVGSELCKDICILQRHFSNLEIKRAASDLLEEEKYEKIACRIDSRKALEARREKYFLKQALNTIRDCIGNEQDEEVMRSPAQEVDPTSATDTQSKLEDPNLHECIASTPTSLSLTRPEMARASEQIDQLRMSKMSVGTRVTEIPVPSQDITIPEVEQREFFIETDLNAQLEEILEYGTGEPPQENMSGEPDVPQPENDDVTLDLGSLPPPVISPEQTNKKRRRCIPVFDESLVILNYSERAKRLNESIVIERVQVYEGPQSIIQSFTLGHLLETPAVNNGLSKTVRGSALERLYKRHQKTEKRPHTDANLPVGRSTIREAATEEDSRHPSRSEAQKSNVFDISTMHPNLEEIKESAVRPDVAANEWELEKLVGTPISKILQREAGSLQAPIGSSDPWLPPRSPRMQNLRGKSIEPPIAEPWFQPVWQSPPDDKWREFSYVRSRLDEVWRENGTERGATLRQLLGEEWSKENMLTLLRIVDKMSIKREVVIDGTGLDIVIRPFKIPYVTEKQFALRFNPPKY